MENKPIVENEVNPAVPAPAPAPAPAPVVSAATADDVVIRPAAQSVPAAPAAAAPAAVPAVQAPAAQDVSAPSYAAPTYASDGTAVAQAASAKTRKPVKGLGWKISLGVAGALLIIFIASVFGVYFSAQDMYSNGDFDSAKMMLSHFDFLPPFRQMANECDYADAMQNEQDGNYYLAHMIYKNLKGYKDSDDRAKEMLYLYALDLIDNDSYDQAKETFEKLGDYKDSAEYVTETMYLKAEYLFEQGKYNSARDIFLDLDDYKDSEDRAVDCIVEIAVGLYNSGKYTEASDLLEDYVDDYEKAEVYSYLCMYGIFNESGATTEIIGAVYSLLEEYADDYEDVEKALKNPFFHIVRFFGAEWECENAGIRADLDEMMIYHNGLPWARPNGDISVYWDDEAMYIFTGEELWFSIDSFSSYDELHPDKMYVTGSDGERYVFEKVAEN